MLRVGVTCTPVCGSAGTLAGLAAHEPERLPVHTRITLTSGCWVVRPVPRDIIGEPVRLRPDAQVRITGDQRHGRRAERRRNRAVPGRYPALRASVTMANITKKRVVDPALIAKSLSENSERRKSRSAPPFTPDYGLNHSLVTKTKESTALFSPPGLRSHLVCGCP